MKVTIITVVFNGEKYLKDCIESVLYQDYKNIEYIVIDGGSTDRTLSVIESYRSQIHYFISEKDKGMYDALNKGIKVATGDVIGILNADDMLASSNVISAIVNEFNEQDADGIYGNLNYIDLSSSKKIIRRWVSNQFVKNDILLGWMPAHPTLYLKKELFTHFGNYSLDFGTAADYELMVRFLYVHQVNARFLDKLIVNMRVGGMSNSSLKQRYLALTNDYKAAKKNSLPYPLITIFFKKITKFKQFLF
jgi:glycosyltransferase